MKYHLAIYHLQVTLFSLFISVKGQTTPGHNIAQCRLSATEIRTICKLEMQAKYAKNESLIGLTECNYLMGRYLCTAARLCENCTTTTAADVVMDESRKKIKATLMQKVNEGSCYNFTPPVCLDKFDCQDLKAKYFGGNIWYMLSDWSILRWILGVIFIALVAIIGFVCCCALVGKRKNKRKAKKIKSPKTAASTTTTSRSKSPSKSVTGRSKSYTRT